GCSRQLDVVTSFSGKHQHGIAMGLPVLAQHLKCSLRQRNIPVLTSFPVTHVQDHPCTIDVGHLDMRSFLQSQPARVDSCQEDSVARQTNQREYLSYLFGAEDRWQLLLTGRPDQLEEGPLPAQRPLDEE